MRKMSQFEQSYGIETVDHHEVLDGLALVPVGK